MNDLHTRRTNDADLEQPIHDALAAILDAAPPARTAPTDPHLLDRYQPGNHRRRLLVGAAAASVLLVGVGSLVVMNQPDEVGVSDSLPDPSAPATPVETAPVPTEPPTTTSSPVDPLATATGFILPTYVPAGYEITHLSAYPMPADQNTVATNLGLTRIDGSPGGFISAASMPNTSNDTLDTLQAQGDGYERQVIGGIERLVQIKPPDNLGPFTNVQWIEAGSIFTVTGRAASEEVVAVAEEMSAATSDEFAAVGASITNSAAALDVMDETTFDDDLAVSVRRLAPGESGSGAIAICVDVPFQRCRFSFSEGSMGGAYQNSLMAAFDINGDTIVIAWQDTAEAARLGEPTLSASGLATDPSQAQPGISTAEIDQQVTTNAGRFTRINVPAGEQPPQINYTIGDGQIGMSTSAPSPYEY